MGPYGYRPRASDPSNALSSALAVSLACAKLGIGILGNVLALF